MTLPSPPVVNPGFLAGGLVCRSFTEVIDMRAAAAANFPLANSLPAGAIVIATALSIPNTIAATTATKIGVGRSTATADPDKYLLSPGLTAAELAQINNQWASPLTATEALAIYACDNAGAAAGTIGGGSDDYVIVRVTYLEPVKIY